MTSAPVSYRPCVSTTPITTSRFRSRSVRAASSIAYVLPTPGAGPKKTMNLPASRASLLFRDAPQQLVGVRATSRHARGRHRGKARTAHP